MISGDNISIVVQGPIHGRPDDPLERRLTQRVLTRIRQIMPAAELILSTWKNSNTSGLSYDQLVINEDPGAVSLNDTSFKHIQNNLNRQLLSTRRGLESATRTYGIKLRTDCLLQRAPDYTWLETNTLDQTSRLFEKRIVTLNLATRHPLRRPVLFHISDIFHFGVLSDLRKLWYIPMVEEPAFTRSIKPDARPSIDAFPGVGNECFMRCAPEQYLIEQLCRQKFRNFTIRHPADGTVEDLFLSLRIMANNFLVLTPAEAGVDLPASVIQRNLVAWDFIRPEDRAWLNKWCAPSAPIFTQLRAAAHFRLIQMCYRTNSRDRVFWQRALGRILRAST